MKSVIRYILIILAISIVVVLLLGMYKFNYLSNLPNYDVDGNIIPSAEIKISHDIIYFKGETEKKNYQFLLGIEKLSQKFPYLAWGVFP